MRYLHRAFIIATITIALLASSSTVDSASVCNSSHPVTAVDIVIVGAGIAGISAYQELTANKPNLNIVILEATDRIGGRVKNVSLGGYTIEQGANWFHSTTSSFWELGKKVGINTSKTVYRDVIVYNNDGKMITNQYTTRMNNMQRERKWFQKAGPYRRMLEESKKYWDGTTFRYDGSENVISIMKQYGYKPYDELDAYVRWHLIDYEYTYNNVALLNYDGLYGITNEKDSEPFVIDPRGMLYVLLNYVKENNIPNPLFGIQVTDIIYSNHNMLDATYKVLVQSRTKTGNCVQYKAKRVVVTVPPSILRGTGYGITFSPALNTDILPSVTGQYNKVFYKFSTRFWDNRQFIGIIRTTEFRGVCNHWHNVDYNVPGCNILMCTLTNEGMTKVKSLNLTASNLLEPLRNVYGNTIVDNSLQDTYFSRYDLDPATGYGAYATIKAGYTIEDYYKFYGGLSPEGFIKGEGYNSNGTWVVYLSGAASCFEYNEQLDGAFYSGKRSARYVLRSLGTIVSATTDCENW